MDHFSNASAARLLCATVALAFTAEALAIDEIKVSARKRDENLQDVPIAIEAFTAEQINKFGLDNLKDVTNRSASLILDEGFSPQDTKIVIRGLAPIQGRQNAAVLQDGIDISSQAIATNGGSLLINPRLFDIERIEVVKGPQNALYGRSAFAGAINYITRKPTEELRATAGVDVGNYGQLELRGGISGPLVGNTLLGGINISTWQHDGYYDSPITGAGLGGESGDAIAGTLVWNATDTLSFSLRGEYTDDEFESGAYFGLIPTQPLPIPAAAQGTVISASLPTIPGFTGTVPSAGNNIGVGQIAGGIVAPTVSENPRTGADFEGTDREISRVTLTADWELDGFDVVYLGAFGNQKSTQNIDGQRQGSITDRGLSFGAELLFEEDTDLISQEIRLQSNGDGPLGWTVGALYWEQDQDFRDGSVNCVENLAFVPFPPPGFLAPAGTCGPTLASVDPGINGANRFPDIWSRETEHWSAYFLVDWEFVENFQLVLEGRYTDEELTITGPDRPTTPFDNSQSRILDSRGIFGPMMLSPQAGSLTGVDSDSYFTPKATVQWTPTDDSLYYFSYAQGRKPSGIAALNGGAGSFLPEDQRFEQEKVAVWELGAKNSFLDNRLTLNSAVFFQDYSDKQTNTQVLVGTILSTRPVNASSAEVWGLEFDTNWLVTDNLNLSLSYTYLDTEYKEFTVLGRGAAPIALAGNCTVITTPAGDTCRLDYSGNRLESAPKNSAVAGLSYRPQLGGGYDGLLEGDVIYQGDRFQDNANRVKFDSYTLVNLRAGITSDAWDFIAYVDNAFEDNTVKTGFRSIYTGGFTFAPNPFTVVLPSSFVGLLPDKRQVGLRVNYRFGD